MKYRMSAALFLALCLVIALRSVRADCPPDVCPRPPSGNCVPTYSMASCDHEDLGVCGFPIGAYVRLTKRSFWDVIFPNGLSYRPRVVYGEGVARCVSGNQTEPYCWPLFHCPQAGPGQWVQIVEDRNVLSLGSGVYTCGFVRNRDDSRLTVTCGGSGGGIGSCGGCDPSLIICEFGSHVNECCFCERVDSPILIDTLGDGFDLTDAAAGVSFDIDADGVAERISWTAAGSDDAFLTLDRNGNGHVDGGAELFGNYTPQPPSPNYNGFLALAEFDKSASRGNGDGLIDNRDAVFASLRLWKDRNHDGVAQTSELYTLPSLDVVAMELDYRALRRTDRHGNRFLYRAKVFDASGASVGRWAWDAFLLRG